MTSPNPQEPPVSKTPKVESKTPSLSYRAREWLKVNPETEAYVTAIELALAAAERAAAYSHGLFVEQGLRAEAAEAKLRERDKDVERYRYLRDTATAGEYEFLNDLRLSGRRGNMDGHIDAALAAEKDRK